MKETLSAGMKNYETRTSNGYCGICGKNTIALWERVKNKLSISCEECGAICHEDENRFNDTS